MIKHRENIYLGLLCLLILTLLTSYYSTVPIVLLVLFFLSDKKTTIKQKFIKAIKNPITLILITYFLMHLIGFLCSGNNSYALKEVTQRLSYVTIPIVIFGEYISGKRLKKALRFFNLIIITVLFILVAYHYLFYQKTLSSFVYFGFKALDISPFYYSVFIFAAMKINLIFKMKYWYIELVILFLFLFLLGNRTSILFISIYMLYVFFRGVDLTFFKKSMVTLLLLVFGSVVLVFSNSFRQKTNIFFKTISFDIETIQTKNSITTTRNTLEHRILIWSLAKDMIKENPVFGVGTSNYKNMLYQQYETINFKAAIKHRFNTHNQYIEEILKFGFIGGSVFLIMIIGLIKQTLGKEIVFPVLLLVLVLSFFESFWYRHHGVLIISFVLPLLYVYNENKEDYSNN